jgi:hypothetical protein
MRVTRRTATNWGIVEETTTWEIVTYFAASTGRIVTYYTGGNISTRRTFPFGRKTKG